MKNSFLENCNGTGDYVEGDGYSSCDEFFNIHHYYENINGNGNGRGG